ncbi:MAG TPA: coniferyl aldehyde dehydrogenase, partial [Deltaproteobacteria bacterium]|nr:coniferyl aldehyde dehydrogenase [Deltaproteobacteria bacterium]
MDDNPTIPATEEADSADVHKAFDALRAAWKEHGGLTYKQRMSLLGSLARTMRVQRDDLAAAISADYGNRSTIESILGEIFTV